MIRKRILTSSGIIRTALMVGAILFGRHAFADSSYPAAVSSTWASSGTLTVSFKIGAGSSGVSIYAAVFINGDFPQASADTSGFNLDGNGMRLVSKTIDTNTTFTFVYTNASVQAANGHANVLSVMPSDVCVVLYHTTGAAKGAHSLIGTGPNYNTDNSYNNNKLAVSTGSYKLQASKGSIDLSGGGKINSSAAGTVVLQGTTYHIVGGKIDVNNDGVINSSDNITNGSFDGQFNVKAGLVETTGTKPVAYTGTLSIEVPGFCSPPVNLTPPPPPTPPDLSVTKSLQPGKTSIAPNDSVVYTITASELNSVAVTGVIVADTIPAYTIFVSASDGGTFSGGVVTFPPFSLAGNSSVTRTITLCACPILPPGNINFVNAVTINDDGSHGADTNPSNNTFTLVTPCSAPAQGPDISVFLTDGVDTVSPGGTFIYTTVVKNVGAAPASSVVVKQQLPDNVTVLNIQNGGTQSGSVVTWPAQSLNPGDQVLLQLLIKLNSYTGTPPSSFISTSTATCPGDTNTANNSSTDTDTVIIYRSVVKSKASKAPAPGSF